MTALHGDDSEVKGLVLGGQVLIGQGAVLLEEALQHVHLHVLQGLGQGAGGAGVLLDVVHVRRWREGTQADRQRRRGEREDKG